MTTFRSVKRVLCVAAHYDDEALFFGGTLARLHEQGADIHIAVLTGVRYCNPPKTPEQEVREDVRQRIRLGAFARVCVDLHARAYHYDLEQVAEAAEPAIVKQKASRAVLNLSMAITPDLILTHGSDGDYASGQFGGYDVPRAQHQLAHDAVAAGAIATERWARDLSGAIKIETGSKQRLALLDYYRYGCTQAPEWPAERWYPNWANASEERYSAIE